VPHLCWGEYGRIFLDFISVNGGLMFYMARYSDSIWAIPEYTPMSVPFVSVLGPMSRFFSLTNQHQLHRIILLERPSLKQLAQSNLTNSLALHARAKARILVGPQTSSKRPSHLRVGGYPNRDAEVAARVALSWM